MSGLLIISKDMLSPLWVSDHRSSVTFHSEKSNSGAFPEPLLKDSVSEIVGKLLIALILFGPIALWAPGGILD